MSWLMKKLLRLPCLCCDLSICSFYAGSSGMALVKSAGLHGAGSFFMRKSESRISLAVGRLYVLIVSIHSHILIMSSLTSASHSR